jgi:hypothetical protein
MKNIENLTDDLNKLYTEVYEQKIEPDNAKVLKGIAGQIISSSRVNLMYNTAKQKFPKMEKIKFLEVK